MLKRDAMVCLLPRLSLSDLLAARGLVKHLVCQGAAHVMVLAPKRYASEVRMLYGDMNDVRFTFVTGWQDLYSETAGQAGSVLESLQARGYDIVPLASFHDTCPYKTMGVPPEEARVGFQLTRCLHRERALHARVVAAVGPVYAVVHDDPGRRIRRHLLPAGVPVVDVRDPLWRAPNVFDWIQTMDHAAEVHAIDSCFMLLADTLMLRARKVVHAYAGGGTRVRYHDAAAVVYG